MTAILEPQTRQTTQPTQPVDKAPQAPFRPMPALEPFEPAQTQPVTTLIEAPPVRPKPVLTPAGVRILGAVLIGLFTVGVAVQPAPDGPQPVAPVWANVLNGIIQFGLLAILAGILTGRRWTVWAGLATGSSLLALSISCPIDGHHVIAAWWFVQMAVGIVMTALPAAVLRRTRAQAGSNAG
jgi:hypothetical protein